jgi:hypothetical protein
MRFSPNPAERPRTSGSKLRTIIVSDCGYVPAPSDCGYVPAPLSVCGVVPAPLILDEQEGDTACQLRLIDVNNLEI